MFLPVTASAASWQDTVYDATGLEAHGFIESRAGWRLRSVDNERDMSIDELRLQADLSKDFGWGIGKLKGDIYGDKVEEKIFTDLREANLLFSPLDIMDVKIGRQVLTWGTGDLLFINDMFPKDWQSFFIGRDDEYLKHPSDAIKASLFFETFNIDLAYTPVFNNSRYIDGERLSYWNNMLGKQAGNDFVFNDNERNRFGHDAEYAVRLFKAIGSTEFALYGYNGFWKEPEGLDVPTVKLYYPRLSVYGVSARRPLLGGIGNLEIGYYDSREDNNGDDPLIRNSEFRALAGFERELAPDLTGGFQYYLEWMQDYGNYETNQPASSPKKDEYRHLLTLRLTKLMNNQNLRLSLFVYYSPSDQDSYLRPKMHYKITDQWSAETGANLFFGSNPHTFWGQFDDNTNAYAAIRYSF